MHANITLQIDGQTVALEPATWPGCAARLDLAAARGLGLELHETTEVLAIADALARDIRTERYERGLPEWTA